MGQQKKQKTDVYQKITDQVIEKLEQGNIPWRKPWTSLQHKNLISGHEYKGINPFVLAASGYSSPYWLTFKQAKKLNGKVKAGEKSTPVVFWKFIEVEKKDNNNSEDEEEKTKTVPFLRYYNVFNVEQVEGIEQHIPDTLDNGSFSEDTCEGIVQNMQNRPKITNNGQSAYYSPSKDVVSIPWKGQFENAERYYNVLFHELTHSTGHKSRLNRIQRVSLNNEGDYSQEELVAEMGAAFLDTESGIDSESLLENSAAYIQSWIQVLKNDKKMLVKAAGRAQKAADYILNRNSSE